MVNNQPEKMMLKAPQMKLFYKVNQIIVFPAISCGKVTKTLQKLWVECDECKSWSCISCLPVDVDLDESFYCIECSEQ